MTRRTEDTNCARLDSRVGRWASLLATVLLIQAAATTAGAQEATSDNPGVIDTDGDDDQEAQQDDQGNQGDSGGQQGSAPEDQGQVITPENANPNEQYNLPPNFNPNYRPKQTPQNVKVTIDFRQAKLEEVVKFFSGAMNKNFIIANSIQANKTITIISPEEVTLGEAYRAFMAALEMNGLTVVRMGSFLKIVQAKQAISEPGPTYDAKDNLPNEARMVTAIVPVKNADVDRIKEIIGNFTSPAATVITYQTNLIVSENASNLRRIRRLVERLDKGDAGEQVFVYKVQYADATKVAEKLKEIFNEGQNQNNRRRQNNQGQGGEQADFDVDVSQLIADERTNQLIIVSNKTSFEKIKDMISLLDVPTEAGGGQVHVKFLEYANAEELSSTLSNLVSAAQRSNQRNRGGGRGDGGGGQQVGTILQGEVQITSYKPNNALVITAAPKDFVALEEVINKLDRPRRQVYVEAVVMEIGIDTNRTVGLGYNLGLGQDFKGVIPDSAVESGTVDDTEGLAVGQSNFPGITGLGSALQGTGGAIGLLGPLVEIPGTNISLPAFAMLLQATQTDNSVNILSTPSILTMDNEEAEIVVGERVPFLRGVAGGGGGLGGLGSLAAGSALGQSGQQTGQTGAGSALGGLGGLGGLTGGLGGLVSPIDYQDVGLTLRIKPQVNDSRYVRLEVDQEVSDIKGAGGSELTPTQTRRNAKTVVLVKDQSTVVIGGLMRDVENKTVEKVPFLGDIPLVGKLFRKTSTITTKQNLVLMLTPYIIEGEADLQKIYERKVKERKELLKLFGKRDIEYIKSINFQKKSGLLDRMRRNISGAVEMKKAREKAQESFEREGPRYRILGDEREGESQQPSQSGESNESTESGDSETSEESGESGTSDDGTSNSDSNGDQE